MNDKNYLLQLVASRSACHVGACWRGLAKLLAAGAGDTAFAPESAIEFGTVTSTASIFDHSLSAGNSDTTHQTRKTQQRGCFAVGRSPRGLPVPGQPSQAAGPAPQGRDCRAVRKAWARRGRAGPGRRRGPKPGAAPGGGPSGGGESHRRGPTPRPPVPAATLVAVDWDPMIMIIMITPAAPAGGPGPQWCCTDALSASGKRSNFRLNLNRTLKSP